MYKKLKYILSYKFITVVHEVKININLFIFIYKNKLNLLVKL